MAIERYVDGELVETFTDEEYDQQDNSNDDKSKIQFNYETNNYVDVPSGYKLSGANGQVVVIDTEGNIVAEYDQSRFNPNNSALNPGTVSVERSSSSNNTDSSDQNDQSENSDDDDSNESGQSDGDNSSSGSDDIGLSSSSGASFNSEFLLYKLASGETFIAKNMQDEINKANAVNNDGGGANGNIVNGSIGAAKAGGHSLQSPNGSQPLEALISQLPSTIDEIPLENRIAGSIDGIKNRLRGAENNAGNFIKSCVRNITHGQEFTELTKEWFDYMRRVLPRHVDILQTDVRTTFGDDSIDATDMIGLLENITTVINYDKDRPPKDYDYNTIIGLFNDLKNEKIYYSTGEWIPVQH